MKQPTLRPTRKVTAAGTIGLPAGVVLVYILEALGVGPIPIEVAAAIGSITSFIASYFVEEV
jgi:putative flippase GtrA